MNRRSSRNDRPSLLWPLGCAWILGLLCFQLPGRDAPETVSSLDLLAIAKIGVRLLAIAVLGITLLRAWDLPRRPAVIACLLPYAAFVLWAIASTAWSPLKAVSLGQASGQVALLLLAGCLAILWRSRSDTSRIVFHLCLATVVFSVVVVGLDLAMHDLSGLNRDDWSEHENEATGFVHPTTAGATASLGLVLLWGAYLCTSWRWTRILIAPGTLALGTLLVLAMSRMAILMAAVVVGVLFLLRLRPPALAAIVLAGALAATGMLLVDPGFEWTEEWILELVGVVQRGESAEQLASFTGRTELWDAIWVEIQSSPLIGHGYFVTSARGELDVWQGPANRSAHNVLLQVLVSTGLVGVTLFVAGLAWPVWLAARSLTSPDSPAAGQSPKLAVFLVLVALWYAGWGQLSESFMGPVQPESVVFFSLLGVMIAHVQPAFALRQSAPADSRVFAAGGAL